jgi:hypothetical protein
MESKEQYNGHCLICKETFSECGCLSDELKSSIDKSEHTDYSSILLDRIKNKVAHGDGFEDWKEAEFKLGTGSLMLLMDKVVSIYSDQQTKHLQDELDKVKLEFKNTDRSWLEQVNRFKEMLAKSESQLSTSQDRAAENERLKNMPKENK